MSGSYLTHLAFGNHKLIARYHTHSTLGQGEGTVIMYGSSEPQFGNDGGFVNNNYSLTPLRCFTTWLASSTGKASLM